MNYSVLIPLLIPITVAIILPVLASFGRRTKEDVAGDVFRYSIGIQVFLWIGAFLFALMPIVFWFFGVMPKVLELAVNSVFVIFLIFCGIYIHRYVVQLGEDCISIGALGRRNIFYKEIRSAETQTSGRGTVFLVVKYGEKGRISISGDLQDFNDLVKKVKQKIRH